jgi:hypothetical protein
VHDFRVEEVGRLLLCEEGAGGMDLEPGLAIKNPPKKTQKNHLKNPTKNVFFWVFFIFYENKIQTFLLKQIFINK